MGQKTCAETLTKMMKVAQTPATTATTTLASRTSLMLVLPPLTRGRPSWLLLSSRLTCRATPLLWVLPLLLLAHVVGPTKHAQLPPLVGLVLRLCSRVARVPPSLEATRR